VLTLTLLPLGGLATYQTNRAENQDVRIGALALQGLTEQATNQKDLFIQRAIEIARLVGSFAGNALIDLETCNHELKSFVAENEGYSFLGVLPPSDIMICSSSDQVFDATNGPNFADLMDTKSRSISVIPDRPPNGASRLSILEPFEVNGAFAGYISISIPHHSLLQLTPNFAKLGFVNFMTTDEIGDIVTTREGSDTAAQELPLRRSRGQFDCSRR
jgi:hypothetical protein